MGEGTGVAKCEEPSKKIGFTQISQITQIKIMRITQRGLTDDIDFSEEDLL